MKVLKKGTLTIDYFIDDNFLLVKRVDTENKDNEYYKEQILEWKSIIEKFKPERQLIDYTDYTFPITPELQKFTNENLLEDSYKIGLKKVAFLISHNLFVQMSIEKIMDKDAGKMFDIKYFDNFKKAKDWILKK